MSEAVGVKRAQSTIPRGVMISVIVLAMLAAVATVWMFIMTGDMRILRLFVPLLLVPLYVLVLVLVWRDANVQGMPAALWLIVVALLFVIGLALYLVARELRGLRAPPAA